MMSSVMERRAVISVGLACSRCFVNVVWLGVVTVCGDMLRYDVL